MSESHRIGALETGGTKMRVAVFGDDLTILVEDRFPTETPDTTMPRIVQFFESHGPIERIGVGAFGPVTLTGPDRGLIGTTPKLDWVGTNLVS
ncbi:MAG: ROK family protein, partial [Acidimicrobiia bacterium]|nr:ROK family protein [Acidimicrobiia bacterium]